MGDLESIETTLTLILANLQDIQAKLAAGVTTEAPATRWQPVGECYRKLGFRNAESCSKACLNGSLQAVAEKRGKYWYVDTQKALKLRKAEGAAK